MTQINDIITDEIGSVYAETALWCNRNKAVLQEIESEENHRRFKILPVPDPTEEEKKDSLRAIRNQYLADTDKYMIADFPITNEERERYKDYRQYLRDYTQTAGWFDNNPSTFEKWEETV